MLLSEELARHGVSNSYSLSYQGQIGPTAVPWTEPATSDTITRLGQVPRPPPPPLPLPLQLQLPLPSPLLLSPVPASVPCPSPYLRLCLSLILLSHTVIHIQDGTRALLLVPVSFVFEHMGTLNEMDRELADVAARVSQNKTVQPTTRAPRCR